MIEVICGPMFSGKTEELIRRLRRAVIGRQRVQAFKPALDRRYHETRITSHSAQSVEAQAVADVAALVDAIDVETQVVGLDEAQFFGPGLVPVVQALANRGVRVVIAGLDQDYRGLPFEPVPQLLAIAEQITKLAAVCARCGCAAATRTQRLSGGAALVQVGADESYEARCRGCFELPAPPPPSSVVATVEALTIERDEALALAASVAMRCDGAVRALSAADAPAVEQLRRAERRGRVAGRVETLNAVAADARAFADALLVGGPDVGPLAHHLGGAVEALQAFAERIVATPPLAPLDAVEGGRSDG